VNCGESRRLSEILSVFPIEEKKRRKVGAVSKIAFCSGDASVGTSKGRILTRHNKEGEGGGGRRVRLISEVDVAVRQSGAPRHKKAVSHYREKRGVVKKRTPALQGSTDVARAQEEKKRKPHL